MMGLRWFNHKNIAILGLSCLFAFVSCKSFADEPAKQAFGAQKLPSKGLPQSIGFYAKGCLAGAVALPIDGPNWQVMRLSRNRNWGHPALIKVIKDLATKAKSDGWPGLLIGDLAQPRGGPMVNGHASHQIGLDADIWFTPMPNYRLSAKQRENLQGVSMLKPHSLYADPKKWSPAHTALLRDAATNPQVERIFVHPGIKKELCETVRGDRHWLAKIRPYWGHYWHFHIRIKCQAGSPQCIHQQPITNDDGCGKSLAWWFTDEPWAPKKPQTNQKPVAPKVMMVSDLPKACATLLTAP